MKTIKRFTSSIIVAAFMVSATVGIDSQWNDDGIAFSVASIGAQAAQRNNRTNDARQDVRQDVRQTTRRVARRTSRRVNALPNGCKTVVIEGVSYHQCGGDYYLKDGSGYVVIVFN